MNKPKPIPRFEGVESLPIILYINAICTSISYVVARKHFLICAVLMTIFTAGIYLLFIAARRRRLIQSLALIAVAMLCAAVFSAASKITENSIFDFVFTGSSFFDPICMAAVMVVFGSIVGFVCAYFGAYTPRAGYLLLMGFLPLILAARTAGNLPPLLLVYLMASFAASAASVSSAFFPTDFTYFKSTNSRKERLIAAMLTGIAAAGIIAAVPRSSKTLMGDYLNTVFTGGTGYYHGSGRLSNFLANSSVNNGANQPKNNVLFVAKADEPVLIYRWSHDQYNGGMGWSTISAFDSGYGVWQKYSEKRCAAVLLYKLKNAAKNGALSDYAQMLEKIPYSTALGMYITNEAFTPEAAVSIQVRDGSSTKVILHPEGAHYVYLPNGEKLYRTPRDEIFAENDLPANASYMVSYYADRPNPHFIRAMESVDFEALLRQAEKEGVISADEANAFLSEKLFAEDYKSACGDIGITPEIFLLAQEITKNCESDYDKAIAIEKWFGSADFRYDMNYVPKEATAEHFVFESRRGICSDFATASTLLARAAGLPARYAEGFSLSAASLNDEGLYEVTDAQAHAYTLVYLDGYGWLDIDGTRYAPIAEEKSTSIPPLWYAVAFVAAAAIVLMFVFRRPLGRLWFIATYRLRKPTSRVKAVYLHTRRIACKYIGTDEKIITVGQVRTVLTEKLDAAEEADLICTAADNLFYGSGVPPADTTALYRCWRSLLRKTRRRKK